MFDCAACYGNEDQIGRVFKAAFEEGVVERKDLVYYDKKSGTICTERWRSPAVRALLICSVITLTSFIFTGRSPNYHAPGCDVDSRNPDSKPFSVDEFMDTYRQCEDLVEKGLIRNIGISNMTIPKLEGSASPHEDKTDRM